MPKSKGRAKGEAKKEMEACGLKVKGFATGTKTWAADAIPDAMYLYEKGTSKVIITGKDIVNWGLVPEEERGNKDKIDWSKHVSTYNAKIRKST